MAAIPPEWGCDGQRSGVAAVDLPLAGLRIGVLHLQFLLPEAGLLRGCLPEESATATTSEVEPETPGKARKHGSITATASGSTGNAAACGA